MATFPTGGKLTANGFKRNRTISVVRTDMESGPAKQALRSSVGYFRFPVKYLFTAAEYDIFDAWVKFTLGHIGWFDWTDPYTGSTVQARIVNGDISEAAPMNPDMSYWMVGFTLEVLDT